MDEGQPVPWEDKRCTHEEDRQRCTGIQIGEDGKCFAHTDEEAAQKRVLVSLQRGTDLDFARGVPITEEFLTQLLEQAPVEDGRPVLTNPDFTLATFSGDANFYKTKFSGDARFGEATFSRDANFYKTKFSGDANFVGATFSGTTIFAGATFSGTTGFGQATFSRGAKFYEATFSRETNFYLTTFPEEANFVGATFAGEANFYGATFSWDGSFDGAKFSGDARFGEATFSRDANFRDAIFEKARELGPALVLGSANFDYCLFSENIDIDVSANHLSCRRSKFLAGANLRIRWADITLDDADFSAPCLLAWPAQPRHFWEILLPDLALASPSEPPAESRPRIVSLRRANVVGLAISAVDLKACRFMGAHNLDRLRIDGKRQFAERPRGLRKQFRWPPLWKWTTRRALAEEHEWRHIRESGIREDGWYPSTCQPPPPEDVDPLPAADIQNVYRDLRKGREDSKDEPGAADFYYGEMEMRRAAAPKNSFESWVLRAYWLVSGYGLRASRALLALLVTVLICSGGIYWIGVPKGDERAFAEIVVFGMQSTTSFLRAPDVTLTLPGQMIQIALRLLGPLFFGLALLSLRGRVKR